MSQIHDDNSLSIGRAPLGRPKRVTDGTIDILAGISFSAATALAA